MNEEMAAILWNNNISLGEYLENVSPDYFNNLTEECKEQYYNQPMTWADLHQKFRSPSCPPGKWIGQDLDRQRSGWAVLQGAGPYGFSGSRAVKFTFTPYTRYLISRSLST